MWERIWGTKDEYSDSTQRKSRARQRISKFCVSERIRNANVICDIGCGSGDFLAAAHELSDSTLLVGVDRSVSALIMAAQTYPRLRQSLVCADARQLPLADNCADFVSVFGLIEHIEDFEEALDDIKRVSAPNGTIVLTTSNARSVLQIKNALLGLLGRYKYGYQKNWRNRDLVRHLEKRFVIEATFYDHAASDMAGVRLLDRTISLLVPGWARYICYVMRG